MRSLVLMLVLSGCASHGETAIDPGRPGPEEWNRPVTPPADADAQAARAACTYRAGALPAETQGASYPNGDAIPVDHIIIVMQENRSFDHYFQKLPAYGQPDVDVAPDAFSNPDSDGNPVPIFRDTQYCFVDTNHSWAGTHRQINGGAMDGFAVSNEGHHENPMTGRLELLSGARAMGYYDERDLPFYYWLANEFAISDRYFASVPGPTQPNRLYYAAATSFGFIENTLVAGGTVILDYLELRAVNWKIYASGTPSFATFVDKIDLVMEHRFTVDDFKADAAAGTLPEVSIVDPNLGLETGMVDNNDEHPPAMAQPGQRFVAEIVDALVRSPNWPRAALFITYDEHGGQFDHVVPPPACPPDDLAQEVPAGDPPAKFDQYGIRVPFYVVSPWAKRHHVSHAVYDHTSILRFIEARYVMPALTHRDANALAPWDMFDFENPPRLETPPITLPEIPQAALDACHAMFGN
ncbi:MAG TPA: alkaline phosphatase family protein [Polyangiaceae bacterium]|nr:alkaline phosphatase family protein [Polyangiaceae bacterium]